MASFNYQPDTTFQFLLFLIRKHIHRDNQDYSELFDVEKMKQVDFDYLFKLITYHKVELIVLPILKELNMSEFNYDRLAARARIIVQKQLLMEKTLIGILSKFDENNIDSVVLKGIFLDKKLYGSQNKRVYRDIDLLIKDIDIDIDKAHELLSNMGFKLSKNLRYTPEFIKKYPTVKYGIKDLIYTHPEFNIILELHWRISTINTFKIELSNQDFFEAFMYGEKQYHSLKNEYELAYLIQHGAESGWHRLKWLIDIVDYIKLVDIDRQLFSKTMQTSKGYNHLLSDLRFILKDTMNFEHRNLNIDSHISKSYFLKNYRQKYIASRIYEANLSSIERLTTKELFYKFIICSNKLEYLKTYAIGFYYKRKALKQIK